MITLALAERTTDKYCDDGIKLIGAISVDATGYPEAISYRGDLYIKHLPLDKGGLTRYVKAVVAHANNCEDPRPITLDTELWNPCCHEAAEVRRANAGLERAWVCLLFDIAFALSGEMLADVDRPRSTNALLARGLIELGDGSASRSPTHRITARGLATADLCATKGVVVHIDGAVSRWWFAAHPSSPTTTCPKTFRGKPSDVHAAIKTMRARKDDGA